MSTAHPERQHVTLDTIAQEAGVSRATVSKALSGRQDVSEATRTRIFQIAHAMGYDLARTRTHRCVVTLVFDTVDTFYTNRVLAGAAATAAERGVILDVRVSRYLRHSDADTWIRDIAAAGHHGLILVTMPLHAEQLATLEELGLPVVAVDPVTTVPLHIPTIGSTNWHGGVAATEHLLQLGHRRIGFVCSAPDSVPARERLMGYQSALRSAGIEELTSLICPARFSYEAGLQAGEKLLALAPDQRPTAIVAACDNAAAGVYEAVRQAGLSVPEDISVVGFDDTFLAQCAAPPLTTVHQALEVMGSRAVETALDLAHGVHRATTGSVQIPTHLVIRQSTARPRTT